jgi:hypothetical protein
MIYLILFPFIFQTLIIFLDEFYFHWKRDLPRWERIGHPLDTLSVLLCFGYVLFFPYDGWHLKIYIGIALFSCVFVTKDEFVHKECCPASEQWLHALLFLNHPVILTLLWILWVVYKAEQIPSFLLHFEKDRGIVASFLWMQTALVGLYALYQALYWNVIRKKV